MVLFQDNQIYFNFLHLQESILLTIDQLFPGRP